jgi:hypothetical protein
VLDELHERRRTPTAALKQEWSALTQRLKEVEEQLARRESVSESDLSWQSSVLKAKAEAADDSDDSEATDAPTNP